MFKALLTVFLVFAVAQCAVSHVEENLPEVNLTTDWEGLIQCLNEASPYAKEVIEIISLVRQKKYDIALLKAIALIQKGSILINKCIGYLNSVSLKAFDWKKAGECLVKVASSSAPAVIKLVQAIASKDATAVVAAIPGVIAVIGNIPSQCARFW